MTTLGSNKKSGERHAIWIVWRRSIKFGELGAGVGQGFHDYIDYNVEAEALGYYSTFLVEHHFTGWSQISATLNLLTWLAARTKTLRVGTTVLVLPWHNPVLLAEQAATLDLLSGGRLDFGIGKGYRHSEFFGFCIPIEEAEARFEEGLEVIVKAWTSNERFSHAGRFWKFQDIIVEPTPRQRPHPPIWTAAGSEASIKKVAERGFNLLLDQFASPEVIGQRIEYFKKQIAASKNIFDPMKVAVARDVYVAKNRADKDEALRRHSTMRQRTVEAAKAPGRAGGSHILSYSLSDASTEQNALFGTPDEIADKLKISSSPRVITGAMLSVGIFSAGPTIAAEAPPAADSNPATPNIVAAFVRLLRVEACFAYDMVRPSSGCA